METISNLVNAVGNALELFTSSVTFVVEMVGYIPAILGSAVIVVSILLHGKSKSFQIIGTA